MLESAEIVRERERERESYNLEKEEAFLKDVIGQPYVNMRICWTVWRES